MAKIHKWFKPKAGKITNVRFLLPSGDEFEARPYLQHHFKNSKQPWIVIFKSRSIGMSWCSVCNSSHPGEICPKGMPWSKWSFRTTIGVEGKDYINKCKKCGHIRNWRDYTKYQQRPERERRHLERCCTRCHALNPWVKLDLDNPLDKALAAMGAL